MRTDSRIPVHLLTGFLGSGKTTLLRALLADPALADTAVVINEFGEVGLDHLLVREVAEDVVLLSSGCLCCTVRDDLVSSLAELNGLACIGELPPFRRVVVESTGLADPGPIMQAIMSEKKLVSVFRLGRVTTTVDAVGGAVTLDRFEEAVRQVMLADRLILTKVDVAASEARAGLMARLKQLNPLLEIVESEPDRVPDPEVIFGDDEIERSVSDVVGYAKAPQELHVGHHTHRHDDRVGTFVVRLDEPVSWAAFVDWLEMLLAARGESILRVKGLLAITGSSGPSVVQGVQHVLYPPEQLARWPEEDRCTRLVFIARDLTARSVERSIADVLNVRVTQPQTNAAE